VGSRDALVLPKLKARNQEPIMSRQHPKRGGFTLLGVAGGIAVAMLFVALNSADEDTATDAPPVLIDSAPASTSVPVHAASLERAPAPRSALRSAALEDSGIDWSRVERAPEMPTF
jgi:hypothetical protein